MAAQGNLKVALFVEGGESPLPPRQTKSALELIWNEHLPTALGLRAFSTVVPISKKHLVAMDPGNPAMSGAGEALDQLMARTMKRHAFDAAVIAWDLVPAWNPEVDYCRWRETLDLYRHLSRRNELPEPWRQRARHRLEELEGRSSPSARHRRPKLVQHQILPLCMEPMFESLILQEEAAIKRAMGLRGKVPRWPNQGWGDAKEKRPDEALLAPAILAAQGAKPATISGVRGTMRTNKDGWGEFLLRRLLVDPSARAVVLAHPIAERLDEIGPR